MKKFNILSDKRFDEIGQLAYKDERREKFSIEAIILHNKLIEVLGDSSEVRDLLDEFDSTSSCVGSIENEIYYEQGFKDALIFLMGKEGG